MDLPVHRVKDLVCASCGGELDPKAFKPLSTAACPHCDAPVHVPAQFDTYRLIRFLGAGGTGFVMEAFDETLHRRVAIKVLRSGGDADKVALEATREARSLAKLNHPAIVHIYSLGEYQGHKYIVMELLDGGSAKQFTTRDTRLDEPAVLDLAITVTEGLAAAQRVKLVHMDVKPGNILYDDRGEARLIDFGAAQFARMRKNAGVIGTPYYIAPEVARGGLPDFKSDIYSLGASLFHLLTGDPPFDGSDPNAVIAARLKRPAPAVASLRPDANPATAAVIGRMLAHDPADRYPSYDALLDDLRGTRKALDDPTGMSGAALSAAVSQPRHAALANRRKSKLPAWVPVAVVGAVMICFIAVVALNLNTDLVGPTVSSNPPGQPVGPDTPVIAPGPAGATPPKNSGRLVRQFWRNIPGASAESIARANLFDSAPTEADYTTSLAQTVPIGSNYAQRLRGYLFAPHSGTYRFVLSADDSASVYLAADDKPARGKLVARAAKPMSPTDYTEPGDPVELEAGKRYTLEVVHKQADAADHLIVGWIMPDGARQTPIRNAYLLPITDGFANLDRWNNRTIKDPDALRQLAESTKPDAAGLVDRLELREKPDKGTARRIRGTLRVPADGQYIFELNTAGIAAFSLSSNDSPATLKPIADLSANNKPDNWSAATPSAKVELSANAVYYFEALHFAPGPNAFLQVGLRHPDGFIEHPIPGTSLAPVE